MYKIMEYVESESMPSIDQLLWSYYEDDRHARLRQVIDSWLDHPEFRYRQHILEEAFASHSYGLYAASICTLVPQIEGLGSHTVRERNLHAVDKNGQDIGWHLGYVGSVTRRIVNAAEAADPGWLHWVRTHSTQAYLDIFTVKTHFEREYDLARNYQEVSRHGIAHGFQIQGYTWLNSLRLFLLLDSLHYLLGVIERATHVN